MRVDVRRGRECAMSNQIQSASWARRWPAVGLRRCDELIKTGFCKLPKVDTVIMGYVESIQFLSSECKQIILEKSH